MSQPPRSSRLRRARPARSGRPFAGRRIAVTRPRARAGALVRALERLGAEVVAAPTIRIRPLADLAPLGAALRQLSRYAWLIFTSQNAVDVVCDRLPDWGLTPPDLTRVPIAAIGPATAAALARRGVSAALIPERFVAEALVAALAERGPLRGRRVLLPRAREARDALPAGLRARGAVVDVIAVYETLGEAGDGGALARDILARRIDAITFTSSSTVRHFVDLVGREAATSGRFAAAAIGPVTAATARELGIAVTIEAGEYSVPGLLEALRRHFAAATTGRRGKRRPRPR